MGGGSDKGGGIRSTGILVERLKRVDMAIKTILRSGVRLTKPGIIKDTRDWNGQNEAENKNEGSRRKGNEITISWWNGGGALISRVKVNPVLMQFLDKKPDIFAYGEAQIYKYTNEINIRGYRTIVHTAQTKGKRRGIVIYYRKKYENVITKTYSSKKFDIIWL